MRSLNKLSCLKYFCRERIIFQKKQKLFRFDTETDEQNSRRFLIKIPGFYAILEGLNVWWWWSCGNSPDTLQDYCSVLCRWVDRDPESGSRKNPRPVPTRCQHYSIIYKVTLFSILQQYFCIILLEYVENKKYHVKIRCFFIKYIL